MVALFKVPEMKAALVALVAPVSPPVTAGTDQLYSVPAGIIPLVLLVGVTAKEAPVQIEAVIGLITAEGLTVTVTVNAAPLQEAEAGVTI